MRRLSSAFPTYFAFVMATGILCVDAQHLGYPALAWVLIGFGLPVYWLVWACGLLRLLSAPAALWRELSHHASGPMFLTSTAASAVLGSDLIALGLPFRFAEVLFGIAIAAWVILTYAFLAAVTEGREKPPLETGLNGAWLLIVVSTASLAVLGGDLLKQLSPAPFLTFACSVWLGLAWLYYALLGSMIFYRFVFIPMPSEDITGPWWINAGAAAITVLAGGQLLAQPGLAVGTFQLHDLIAPLIILFWADATFWIPLLLILFAWKHLWRGRRLRYSVEVWSVVFPMGMYAAATLQFSQAFDIPFITPAAQILFWSALVLWAFSVAGLVLHVVGLNPKVAAG